MRLLVVVWGIGGITAVLVYAIYRLSLQTIDALTMPLEWYHLALLAANIAFMAYSEGYKGFQKMFAPRVAARARYLYDHGDTVSMFFAPLFCAGYFRIVRSRQIAIFALTIGITVLVNAVRQMPQPYRGIADAGVVVGLTYGLVVVLIFTIRVFTGRGVMPDPEINTLSGDRL